MFLKSVEIKPSNSVVGNSPLDNGSIT